MNANDQFYARDAHVDAAAIAPLPNSRKIHVTGSRPDLRVPMREIAQADTPAAMGAERNPPIVVYDTSGPYTDPAATKPGNAQVGKARAASQARSEAPSIGAMLSIPQTPTSGSNANRTPGSHSLR